MSKRNDLLLVDDICNLEKHLIISVRISRSSIDKLDGGSLLISKIVSFIITSV